MDRRIFGLESEYGVTCTLKGQRRLSPDEVARYLFRRVVSWGRSSNVFLGNGARLYLDVGSHPEYATPECDSLFDLVAHDKAGERILEQLVESAEERLDEEGVRGDIYLFRNNTDSAGNSYGCHENYLTGRADGSEYWGLAIERFLDIVEEEIGTTPQYGLTPAPRISWMWRHQSRMSLLSVMAAQNAYRFWQTTWGSLCVPKKAA